VKQSDLIKATSEAVEYLFAQQQNDGHWEDFQLPMGASDEWVTAFVGEALAMIIACPLWSRFSDPLSHAIQWLLKNRHYRRGWGFNARTGPDADSTAYVLRLLRRFKIDIGADDESWLQERWHPDGGIATYEGPAAWGMPHPDVTAVAFQAFSSQLQQQLLPSFQEYLIRTRRPDGTWPAYWWRTCHYSTFHSLSLARSILLPGENSARVIVEAPDRQIYTAFDLAYAAGISYMRSGVSTWTLHLLKLLLMQQIPGGGWQGGFNLRVTHHECYAPWEKPEGNLYKDINGLITTASALRAFAYLLS
jgi:hypothetical protein